MSEKNENIKCVVRIRPAGTNEMEKKINETCASATEDNTTVQIESNSTVKSYQFDSVFGGDTSQESVFNEIGQPIIDYLFQGYNCTIFAYGQTGSGKTHTMMGPYSSLFNENDKDKQGLIPRMLFSIFGEISKLKKENSQNNVSVKCSCSEIYQEQIIDLLNNNAENLTIYEDAKKGTFVDGLTEQEVDNDRIALELILLGLKNRHVAATNMNAESSRSHLIFTIGLNISVLQNGLVSNRQSRLHLVDLAGSERQKSTGAKGDRVKEAGMINKSLTTLGTVINALVDEKSKFVPFRDSKLTFFLKDTLGGNSKTTIIANISPCLVNIQETISTLKFVQRAKLIRNKASINENVSGSMKTLQDEIARLKAQLSKVNEKKQVCEKCKRRMSLMNIMGNDFQNIQRSIRTSMRKSMINAQDLLCLQMKIEEEKSEANNQEKEDEKSIDEKQLGKDEIREFILKIKELINYENELQGKLTHVDKVSDIYHKLNEEKDKFEKEYRTMLDDFDKKLMHMSLIFKIKENVLMEIGKETNHLQLSQDIEKILTEEHKLRTELENQTEFLKVIEENINLKTEIESITITKDLFNKKNIEVLISIINEFVDTNNMLQIYIREHIEPYISDNKVDALLLELNDIKLNFISLEKENLRLKEEIQELNEKRDLKEISMRNLGVDLENKLKEMKEIIEAKEVENEYKNQEIETKNKEIDELKSKLSCMEKELGNSQNIIEEFKNELDILSEGNRIYEKDMITKNEENVHIREIFKFLNEFYSFKGNKITIETEHKEKNHTLELMREKIGHLENIYKIFLTEINQKGILENNIFNYIQMDLSNTVQFYKDEYSSLDYDIKIKEEKSKEIKSLILEENSVSKKILESVMNHSQLKKEFEEKYGNMMKYVQKLEESLHQNNQSLEKLTKEKAKPTKRKTISTPSTEPKKALKKIISDKFGNETPVIVGNISFKNISTIDDSTLKEEKLLNLEKESNKANEKKIKELEIELNSLKNTNMSNIEENNKLKTKINEILNNNRHNNSNNDKDKKDISGINYQIKLLLEEKKRLEIEIQLLSSDFYKNLSEASINQKLRVLMKIKEENYKLKIELNEFKKRNEYLEINLQHLQNNVINDHQKFQSLQSVNFQSIENDDEYKLIKKEYFDILDRIFALNINSQTISKQTNRYNKAVEYINALVHLVDLQQFYKDFQKNNQSKVLGVNTPVITHNNNSTYSLPSYETNSLDKSPQSTRNPVVNVKLASLNSQISYLSKQVEIKRKGNDVSPFKKSGAFTTSFKKK